MTTSDDSNAAPVKVKASVGLSPNGNERSRVKNSAPLTLLHAIGKKIENSNTVAQRSSEFGIRIALGAQRSQVLGARHCLPGWR